jgi:hypothetical protein
MRFEHSPDALGAITFHRVGDSERNRNGSTKDGAIVPRTMYEGAGVVSEGCSNK